jgi:hypothetical protein
MNSLLCSNGFLKDLQMRTNSSAAPTREISLAIKRATEKATFPLFVSAMIQGRAYPSTERVTSRPVAPGAKLYATDRVYEMTANGNLVRLGLKSNRRGDTRLERRASMIYSPGWLSKNKYNPQACPNSLGVVRKAARQRVSLS